MPRPGAVLAIDHGTKRCGFAIVDGLRIAAHALDPWRGEELEALIAHVARLLDEREVSVFLLGLPLNMDGSEGPRAADVRAFGARLVERFPRVELVLWDERLTTKAAEELLRESGHRGADARARRDSWSALVLLRDWLESGERR